MFWRGVLGYLPANLLQGVTGLLGIVVFTRLLTPEAYGAYALAFSVAAIVHYAGFVWLEAAMARFYAREDAAGALDDHFATLYRAFAVAALALLIGAGGTLWLLPLAGPLKAAVAAGLLALPLRSLVKLAQEHRRAAGRVGPSALLDMSQSGGAFLFGAAFAALGGGGAAPLAGAAVAAAMGLIFVLAGELKLAVRGRFRPGQAAEYARYGVPVSLSLIFALALATTDRFVLAGVLGPASVGAYHAGYSLSSRTLDVLFIWLGMAGGPACVAALERGGPKALHQTAQEQASVMVLICLPAAVGLALVARPLAEVLVGPDLRDAAAHVTPWIAFSGLMAGATTYYFHTAFTLARKTPLLLVAMAIPAAVNLALALLLIPRYGIDGAVWATAASYGLGLVSSCALGRFAMPLPIPWDALVRCGLSAAGMALAVMACPSPGGVAELALKAAVGMIVYAVLAVALDAADIRSRGSELVRSLQGAPA